MLGVIKLLYSLSEAAPIFRSLIIDLVSLLKDINASRRKTDKDICVESRIQSVLYRLHHDQAGQRKPPDEPK